MKSLVQIFATQDDKGLMSILYKQLSQTNQGKNPKGNDNNQAKDEQ